METATCLLLGLLMPLAGALFQETTPSKPPHAASPIRVKVEAVNVLVTVVDKDGRFLTDLPLERFSLSEDGVPQTITSFTKETTLPVAIGLMVDSSGSVQRKLGFEKKAAASFLHKVLRPEDKAILVEFDNMASLLQDFTNDPVLLVKAMQTIQPGGGTALFDAICRVCRQKLYHINSRRALVVISDGDDLHSRRSIAEAVEAAQRSEVTIYAIGTSNFGKKSEDSGEEELRLLAQQTGGRVFLPHSESEFEAAFAQINEELRSQYSIVYKSSNARTDGRFRKISVQIKNNSGLSVRCKTGYYAGSE